jgi:hypothetical protein
LLCRWTSLKCKLSLRALLLLEYWLCPQQVDNALGTTELAYWRFFHIEAFQFLHLIWWNPLCLPLKWSNLHSRWRGSVDWWSGLRWKWPAEPEDESGQLKSRFATWYHSCWVNWCSSCQVSLATDVSIPPHPCTFAALCLGIHPVRSLHHLKLFSLPHVVC